ncbi:XRE family transcriptional regulator [Mycobacterium sp. MYCO198283]|uniref:XRE family transcriptional regulator n=1 Tax=Mycobacterium sp. MYCO198283 TaxID=2883505 RepID=UPI001E59705E|nr:XRE family transcriptional regulator [Mycobacterium sp. MYCO198283]MCG5431990.1 XRE family transcriptional regulator [Mycobacterium sp. MYCO198283]
MTLASDARGGPRQPPVRPPGQRPAGPASGYADQPVEFWPTSAIRLAIEGGDLAVWQRIVTAIKRDPFGRTARQVEEVLQSVHSQGISRALEEVLMRTREHLEANERAEVADYVRSFIERSGLGVQEFASRIGVSGHELAEYAAGTVSPSAAQMIRMRRLSDRFAKMRRPRPGE